MEILKRARGVSDGEIVSWNENTGNVKEEVLRRSAKAGYCSRDGEPITHKIIIAPPTRRYEENYKRIFKHD